MARPTDEQLKKLHITPSTFQSMVKWGWVTYSGTSLQWFSHQRPNHDDQFQEPRERKLRKNSKSMHERKNDESQDSRTGS